MSGGERLRIFSQMISELTDKEILIRLADGGMTFVYTIRSENRVEDSRAVAPVDDAEADSLILDGYWGGSQVMD